MDSIAGDHAVGAADVLELELDALVRDVPILQGLDDEPVQSGGLGGVEPVHGSGGIVGGGRQVDWWLESHGNRLECRPPIGE